VQGYYEWAERHAAIFGLNTDRDPSMFAAWGQVFESCGYTAAELNEATTYLAGTPGKVPLTRQQNLDAINSRVRDRRLDRLRANDEAAAPDSSHHLCGGSGWVVVPHLKHVVDGEWVAPWYTMAVTCNCKLGQRRLASLDEDRKRAVYTFDLYDTRNPNWEMQVQTREVARKSMVDARRESAEADKYADRLQRAFGGAVRSVIGKARGKE
jgi:hypothetical protein